GLLLGPPEELRRSRVQRLAATRPIENAQSVAEGIERGLELVALGAQAGLRLAERTVELRHLVGGDRERALEEVVPLLELAVGFRDPRQELGPGLRGRRLVRIQDPAASELANEQRVEPPPSPLGSSSASSSGCAGRRSRTRRARS